MPQVGMLWTYDVRIRSKDVSGATLKTWQGYNTGGIPRTLPVRCGPPTYEKVVVPRDLVDYSKRTLMIGFRARVVIEWEVIDSKIRGTPYDLHTVLSDLTPGSGVYFEVSLDGGAYWKACELESEIEHTKPAGKNVLLGLSLTFVGRSVQSSIPNGVSTAAGSW